MHSLIRKKAVAQMFGVDLSTIDRWYHNGKLPLKRVKISGLVMFFEEEVLALIQRVAQRYTGSTVRA